MMYEGKKQTVTLYCENSLMKVIIDRFGENIKAQKLDCHHFSATVEVSASPTFYSWVFNYAGKMKIVEPHEIVCSYNDRLELALRASI